jgi:hypothetical protein
MNATDSRQRTVPVTCSTSRLRISSGSVTGRAVTFATTGTTGALTSMSARARCIASAAGCINAQWKGAETGSISARFAPRSLASLAARSMADAVPDSTT